MGGETRAILGVIPAISKRRTAVEAQRQRRAIVFGVGELSVYEAEVFGEP